MSLNKKLHARHLAVLGALLASTALTSAAMAQVNHSVSGGSSETETTNQTYQGLLVGNGGSGTGSYTVDGATISITGDSSQSGLVYIGADTTGEMTVTGGGTVSVTQGDNGSGPSFIIGQGGQDGTLTILDGSVTTEGNVQVGSHLGRGDLTVDSGGTLTTGTTLNVATEVASDARVAVGNGGVITATGGVILGNSESGFDSGLIVGANDPDAPVAAGTLNTPFVVFDGDAGLAFNHTGEVTFDADVISDGAAGLVVFNNGTTSITGDYSEFAGTTQLFGGTLLVNTSTFSGNLVVFDGSTLGGNGSTGVIIAVDGGTVAPGGSLDSPVRAMAAATDTSIGTLSTSNVTFNIGSTYAVEINDGGFVAGTNNDFIDSFGAATIEGGTIHVLADNGTDDGSTYSDGTYTILTAAGGVTGTFDDLVEDFAYIEFTQRYDANNVYLDTAVDDVVITDGSFCLDGFSDNECAAAGAVYSLGSGNELYDATLLLSEAEAEDAAGQVSGEAHASAHGALVNENRFVREFAFARSRAAFDAVASDATPVLAYANGAPEIAPADTQYFSVWGQAFGAYEYRDGNGNAAALRQASGGVFAGGDVALGETFRLGVLAGYSRSGFSVDDRSSSGNANNYYVGTYGGAEMGDVGLRFGAAYGRHDINTSRTVNVGAFSDTLSADYDANSLQIFGEAGYEIDLGGVAFEPYLGLAHVRVATDGFTEQGGAAALSVESSVLSSTFTTLGVRGETEFALSETSTATLTGGIGWRHAFGDLTPEGTMTFASGGDSFSVTGTPIARDTLVLDLGADVALSESATLGLSYSGEIGSGVQSHAVKATFGVTF